jgi:fibronectin type 3 domain-containing protein
MHSSLTGEGKAFYGLIPRIGRACPILIAVTGVCAPALLQAHPITFNSTIGYSSTQPTGASGSVSNWTGAAFDAANIGGSGVNADGGSDNGTANDASTRVADGQPIQGQTFTTGSNANGYDVTGITARMAGYTNNTASGANTTSWNLAASNGPIHATIAKINGTTHSALSIQNFMAGGTGSPGSGSSANGSGTYLTFNLPYPVHLEPNTTYGFDLIIGNGSGNHFEWLGTSGDPYAGGTAYTRSWEGPITTVTGDRVFQVNMTASTAPYAPFSHPGALHTQADFDRMKAKISAGTEPWKTSYDFLAASPHAQTNWNPYNTDYINRGGDWADNYTRSQMDAQAIYHLALRWKLTGNPAYADRAVLIANVWSDLIGISGDSNASLAAGICGYLFATGGEILSTYPGWPAAEKQAYKDMMMRAFYPGNADFLWRHHGTPNSKGGNTHYRLNWDTANMASMAAIGILCDNRAVYQQAVDYFKNGAGNSRAERAAWYIHPDGTSQTEESGRDQPHNKGGWYAMALLCQMAWNQGDDLFGYDNNRVLRAYEYNAKYNNGVDVPWVYHRNASLTYTEGLAEAGRYPGGYTSYEIIYNHYANVKGVAAPWTKIGMNVIRPEGATGTGGHPSAQDHLGLGSLTYARDDTSTSAAPSGLLAQWSKNQVILNWWGSATATSYQVQRATSIAGPYTTLGTAVEPNLNFTDTTVANGTSYYYKVIAVTPSGNLESTPLLTNQALVASYSFEGNTNDGTGTRHATIKGTTLPGYAAGFGGGQAMSLNGTDQYVQLPVHSGLSRDVTLAAWVYWNGGNAWQRVFDFGSEIEKFMMLTVKDGTGKIGFTMTTSRGTDGTIALTGPTMPTATWTHLAVTFNGETATLYVNGLPVATGSSPRLSPMFSQTFCYLGRSMYNGDAYFNGRIDNFRIYNYGLSGSDIHALWGQGGTNSAPLFSSDFLTRSAATEDTAYTGQTVSGTATDANGGTLTYSKAAGPEWLAIASTGALSGTPTNADVGKNTFIVRVTDSAGATDDIPLYITVNNVNDPPVWSAPTLTKLTVSSGQPYLTASLAGDASDVDTGSSLTFSKVSGPAWLNVASDGTLSGTPAATDAGVNTFTIRVTDNTGATADVTVSITVLGPSLRSRYAFEGAVDDSQGNFNGTATGTPTFATGTLSNAIVLDGTDDYVTLPAGAIDYHNFTVTAWVYWNGGGNWQRIFDFGNSQSSYMMLTPNRGGGMRFTISHGGVEQQLNTSALPTAQWIHVAVTLNGSTGVLYVNGVPKAINTAFTLHPADFKPTLNYIGKSQFNDPLFSGMIDDFRIYNHGLDADTIQTIAAFGSPHLKLDETTGTLAADSTGEGWNGTLVNGPTWSTGKTGNAVNLDGANDHVTLPSSVVNGLTTATIAGWVNLDTIGNWQRIFDFGTGTNNYLFLTPRYASGTLRFAIRTPSTGEQIINGTAALPTGSWQHVAVVLNGATGTLYVNGVQVGQNTAMTLNPSSLGATTANYLGRSQFGSDPYLDGRIDDFRIFARALTADEVAGLAGTTAAPASPVATSGNNQVALSWSAVTGASTYLVKRSTTSGGPYASIGTVTTTSFTDTTAVNGTTYYYVIVAANALGEGIASTPLTSTPQPALPATPVGLAGNGWIGANSLNWTSVSGATSYTVKRSTTSGSGYANIATGLTTNAYTDANTINGTTYYYVVSATNTAGSSGNSTEVAVLSTYPRTHHKFDETTGTSAADATGNGWTGTLVNAPIWSVGRSNACVDLDGINDHVTLPTGVVNGLTNTTISFWANLDSVSSWQRCFDFGTGTTTNMFLTPRNAANGNIRFAITTGGGNGEQRIDGNAQLPATGWHHVTVTLNGATGTLYVDGVQVGQNTAMTLTPSSLGATTLNYLGRSQYSDPYLAGRIDDFRVYARALTASEVASLMATSPTGLVGTPSTPTATGSVGEVTVSWAAVSGATGYDVLRSTTSGGPYTLVGSNITGTSFINGGLTSGTTYYYVIAAYSGTSEGMNSSQVSVTVP